MIQVIKIKQKVEHLGPQRPRTKKKLSGLLRQNQDEAFGTINTKNQAKAFGTIEIELRGSWRPSRSRTKKKLWRPLRQNQEEAFGTTRTKN
jgi:hypothetical protein